MSEREKELAKIEERLTNLRELLERRRTKKQEILDLQAKVALNEAEGLGFYNTEPQTKVSGSGFGGTMSSSQNPWIAVPVEAGAEILVPQATATSPPRPTPVKIAPPAAPAASRRPKNKRPAAPRMQICELSYPLRTDCGDSLSTKTNNPGTAR